MLSQLQPRLSSKLSQIHEVIWELMFSNSFSLKDLCTKLGTKNKKFCRHVLKMYIEAGLLEHSGKLDDNYLVRIVEPNEEQSSTREMLAALRESYYQKTDNTRFLKE